MNSDTMCNQKIWKDVQIDDECYMICLDKEHDTWKVLLTNLVDLWIEFLSTDMVLKKVEELNPLLNTDAFDCNEHLMILFKDIPKYVVTASVNQIKLRIPIEGGILKFSLDFTKASSQQFWENITKPLCLTSMELMRQQKELFSIIQKKDEEIAEYKAEGAELIRKNIETKVFSKKQFMMNWGKLEATNCKQAFQEVIDLYKTMDFSKFSIKKENAEVNNDSKECSEGSSNLQENTESIKNDPDKTEHQLRNQNGKKPLQSTLSNTTIVINRGVKKRKLDFIL